MRTTFENGVQQLPQSELGVVAHLRLEVNVHRALQIEDLHALLVRPELTDSDGAPTAGAVQDQRILLGVPPIHFLEVLHFPLDVGRAQLLRLLLEFVLEHVELDFELLLREEAVELLEERVVTAGESLEELSGFGEEVLCYFDIDFAGVGRPLFVDGGGDSEQAREDCAEIADGSTANDYYLSYMFVFLHK